MKLVDHETAKKMAGGYYFNGTVHKKPLEALIESLKSLLYIAPMFGESVQDCVEAWEQAHKDYPVKTLRKAVEVVFKEQEETVFQAG